MSITLENFAQGGLIKDLVDYTLPSNEITSVNNCRYKFGKLISTPGYTQVPIDFSSIISVPHTLISHFPVDNTSEKAHIFAFKGNTSGQLYLIKRAESGTLVNVSPAVAVTVGEEIGYTYAFGSVIVNPKTGNPLILDVGNNQFRKLEQWTTGMTCSLFYFFKNFYVALSTFEGGISKRVRIRWSHTVEGPTKTNVPPTDPSWIDNDPKYLAGFLDLPDNVDEILCVKELGDRLMIFTNDNIYSLFFTGDSYVFGLNKVVAGKGCCSNNAVILYRNILFVVNNDDVYTFNGNQVQSVIDQKIKTVFLGSISDFRTIRVFKNPNDEEVFIHSTQEGEEGSNKAWVFNLLGGQWTQMDLPAKTKHIENTKIVNVSTSWDDSNSDWTLGNRWSDFDKSRFENRFFYGTTDGLIYFGDFGKTFAGNIILATFGRDRMDMTEFFENSTYPIKYLKQIIPLINGRGEVLLKLGISFEKHTPINWVENHIFKLEDIYWKVDTQISGRYLTYSVEIKAETNFVMETFELAIKDRGQR